MVFPSLNPRPAQIGLRLAWPMSTSNKHQTNWIIHLINQYKCSLYCFQYNKLTIKALWDISFLSWVFIYITYWSFNSLMVKLLWFSLSIARLMVKHRFAGLCILLRCYYIFFTIHLNISFFRINFFLHRPFLLVLLIHFFYPKQPLKILKTHWSKKI
jgi:hypothetical protein